MVLPNVLQWSRILGWLVKPSSVLLMFPWRKEIGVSYGCPETQPFNDLKDSSLLLLSFINPRIQRALYQQVVPLVSCALHQCLKSRDDQSAFNLCVHGIEGWVFFTFAHHPSPSVLYTKLLCLSQIWSLLFTDLTVIYLMFYLPEVFLAIQLILTIPPK